MKSNDKLFNNRLRPIICAMGAAAAAFLILRYPQLSADGAREGLNLCALIVIPALFPFMALCEFISQSGLSARLGKLLSPVTRVLFHLEGNAGAAILMSWIGGYPVGARSADALYQQGQISLSDAQRMLCFCVNAGPAFLVCAVGAGMLHNEAAGWLLLLCHLGSSLFLGMITGLLSRLRRTPSTTHPLTPSKTSVVSVADAFVSGVASAASAMFGICAFVVLFSCLLSYIHALSIGEGLRQLLTGLLETTAGCAALIQGKATLPLIAAALSFGGLCVHCQVFSSCKSFRPRLGLFFLCRAAHAVLAYLLCSALQPFFPLAEQTFSNSVQPVAQTASVSIPASVALLVTCSLLLASTAGAQKKGVEKGTEIC